MDVAYSKSSLKALRKLPSNAAQLIRDKVKQYAAAPESLANQVKRLKGSDSYRLRVGDYRVLFDITVTKRTTKQAKKPVTRTLTIMTVLKIGPRGGVYDD